MQAGLDRVEWGTPALRMWVVDRHLTVISIMTCPSYPRGRAPGRYEKAAGEGHSDGQKDGFEGNGTCLARNAAPTNDSPYTDGIHSPREVQP